MLEVNSTRLYDFAARSLVRVNPISEGLEVILLLMSDLCATAYYRSAVNIFLQGIHRLSTHIVSLLANSTASSTSPTGAALLPIGNLRLNKTSSTLAPILRTFPITPTNVSRRHMFYQRRELQSNLVTYSTILQDYFNRGKAIIGKDNFPCKAYKITAHIYKNAGMYDLMLELYRQAILDDVADKQLKNLVVYNLARSPDHWEAAIDILSEMKDKPDLFMYTSGILACETGGDWEHAIYLLERLQGDGYNLTTVAVTSAIAACAAQGRADEALQLLGDLTSRYALTPSTHTYNCALSACAKAGRWRDALVIYEKMRALSVTASAHTAADPVSGTQPVEQKDEVDFLKATGSQCNVFTYNIMIEALGEGNQDVLVDEVYRHAVADGVFQPFDAIRDGEVDLHRHSVHMAQAAVRLLFDLLLIGQKRLRREVTGKEVSLEEFISDGEEREADCEECFLEDEVEDEEGDDCLMDIYRRKERDLMALLSLGDGKDKERERERPLRESPRHQVGIHSDLTIVVGKGQKLRDAVKSQLLRSFKPSIQAYVHKVNSGRVMVPKNCVLEWLRLRS